jgi:hypothetical protein
MPARITRGSALIGALTVGNGATLKRIIAGTQAINPPSIAATTRAAVTFTLAGAEVGDRILLEPPGALHDDLLFVGARVTAADTVSVYLYNPTGGAVDDGANTWNYTLFDLT